MSDTELTEKQFNDILETMWMASIDVQGMTFNVHEHQWDLVKSWAQEHGISSGVLLYHSDFGTVVFKKVK